MIGKLGILGSKVCKRGNNRKYKNRESRKALFFLELGISIEKAV